MGFSITGTIAAVLILCPSIVFFIIFPPKNVPKNMKNPPVIYTVLERAGQAGCLISLIISKDYFDINKLNIFAILAAVCILIYYGLWARYLLKGQDFIYLWKPLFFIPIPMAVFPVCAFVLLALWGACLWLGIAAAILAVGHFSVSWNSYKQSI